MRIKLFSLDEIETLKTNQYVRSITPNNITYTDEFRQIFMKENEEGKTPREIFEYYGLNTEIIGMNRISSISKTWRHKYRKHGSIALIDTRAGNSGRPLEKTLSLEEKYQRILIENKLLKAENELLKKIEIEEGRNARAGLKLTSGQKFEIIMELVTKYKLKNKVSYLCEIAKVSGSGYYNYHSERCIDRRISQEEKDHISKKIILQAYNFKKRKKGARQIKMTLASHFGVIYNLKRIRRIMKKYKIVCPIRQANPYKRMQKATTEHNTLPNVLKRKFKQNKPGKVLLTDITYLFYGSGKRAFLSAIKDATTTEILAYNVSDNIKLDLATDTIIKLMENKDVRLDENVLLHSDQGCIIRTRTSKSL